MPMAVNANATPAKIHGNTAKYRRQDAALRGDGRI